MKKCLLVVAAIVFLASISSAATGNAAEPQKPIELRFSTFLPLETPVVVPTGE